MGIMVDFVVLPHPPWHLLPFWSSTFSTKCTLLSKLWIHSCYACRFLKYFIVKLIKRSRLMVVSRKAKKGQSDRHKQNAQRTTVCLLHERTFSSFDVIITVNISRVASSFKPALKTQNLLTNINQHPTDKSNRLSNMSFPAMVHIDEFHFHFYFFFLWRK